MTKYRYPNSATPRAADVLADAGIDPSDVIVDGIDEGGYFEMVFDEGGHRVYRDGEPAGTRRTWPTLQLGRAVLAALAEDLAEHPARYGTHLWRFNDYSKEQA